MRSKKLKLVISLLTFSLGLGVFYFWHFGMSVFQERRIETLSENIQPARNDSSEEFDPWKLPESFPPLQKGEFYPVYHGCGNGYVDGWLAYDGSHLTEGFNTLNKKNFDEVMKSVTVIEKVKNYPNKNSKKGLRVILKGLNEKTGKEYYSILWFDKWEKKYIGMYYIDAPNLEIALKLEQKLIKDSQKK